MNDDTESSGSGEHPSAQPSRKRQWYRKKTRDPNFRKREESDYTSDSSENAGTSQQSPRRGKKQKESNVPSDEEEDIAHAGNHSDDATHQDNHGAGRDSPLNEDHVGERNETDDESSDGENDVNSGSDPVRSTDDENDGGNDDAEGDSESDHRNGSDQDVEGTGPNLPHDEQQPVAAAADVPEEEDEGGEEDEGEEDNQGEEEDESEQEDETEEEESDSNSEASDDAEEVGVEDEEIDLDNDNTPIFNGATITFRESALAILTFILSHKLTGLCVTDLLLLLSLHCGPNNLLLKTLYKFKKYFKMIGKDFVKLHYYCSNCEILLPNKHSVCCANQELDTYFIEFPLISQLQNLFSRPGFFEDLQYRFNRVKKDLNNVEEIYDGFIYQQLFDNGFLSNPNNISFFLYFDGVSIFKSSNFSIWPAYLTINELKYKLRTRKEYTLLAGLWFGKKKPNPNLFLSPLHVSLTSLEANGADFTLPDGRIINVKGKIIGAVADMPAKSLFMRFIQYNGAFSCFNCMAQGGRFDLGNTTIQVFPYSRDIELRNNDEVVDLADQAVVARQQNPDASVYGVKGPSLLSALLPNMILCMGIDIMHGVFLGAMRTLLHLWFDSQYSRLPFSISDLVHLVDARLKKIKPPSSFQNMPKSIKKDMAKWKAFDLKAFFFCYSLVVLLGVLPVRYWLHHVQFVTAISILCQESISPADFDSAEAMLHSYVSEFQELYGVRHMTLTFHQLLHLPLVCKNLGPAWVFSCFFYESLNGELVRLVHGTRYVALQICSSSAVFMKLPMMINAMHDNEAKALCLKYLGRLARKVKVTENIDIQTGVVGKMRTCYPVPAEISRLFRENYDIVGGRFKYFDRLKSKGLVYTSEAYVRSKQKKSCFVEIFYENVPHLCKVNSFIRWSSCRINCPLDCPACPKRYFCVVTLYDRLVWEMHDAPLNIIVPHLNKVSPTGQIRVYPVESVRSMCLYMPVDGKEYIALPVNNLEVE